MGGPGALNDALLGGQIQFVNVAAPSLATLWDKTAGTAQEVRAVCAVQSMPYVLVTRNPNVRTIADFTDKDRIAVPTVKISGQAMMLQIAAAKSPSSPRVAFVTGDMMALPFPDGAFDLVTTGYGIRNVPAIQPAIGTSSESEAVEALYAQIPSIDFSRHVLATCPTAEASWYDGVGHAPFLEAPERFNRELGALARRVLAH